MSVEVNCPNFYKFAVLVGKWRFHPTIFLYGIILTLSSDKQLWNPETRFSNFVVTFFIVAVVYSSAGTISLKNIFQSEIKFEQKVI